MPPRKLTEPGVLIDSAVFSAVFSEIFSALFSAATLLIDSTVSTSATLLLSAAFWADVFATVSFAVSAESTLLICSALSATLSAASLFEETVTYSLAGSRLSGLSIANGIASLTATNSHIRHLTNFGIFLNIRRTNTHTMISMPAEMLILSIPVKSSFIYITPLITSINSSSLLLFELVNHFLYLVNLTLR